MPSEIYLVKVGMTMTEGIVDTWYVEDGGHVEVGDRVYCLETEKVNMDVDAEVAGTVRHLVPAGTEMQPGDVVGWIFAEGEDIPEVLPTPKRNENIAAIDPIEEEQPDKKDVQTSPKPAKAERVRASPAAKRLAAELGVEISTIDGTGPQGRITKDDVEAAASSQSDGDQVLPLTGIRRTIADRMFQSLRESAQLTLDMEVEVDALIHARSAVNDEWTNGPHVSVTDMVLAAVARSLQRHPIVNSTVEADSIRLHGAIHIGFAVAIDDGLIVPVIRDAHEKSLRSISEEAAILGDKAKSGSLSLDEVSGGTFTVSSLGMFGVDTFTPILNPPQSAILGVGRIYDSVKWVGQTPTKTQMLRLSLTWDHRAFDGVPAAQFAGTVKMYLEQPARLLAT